MMPSPFTICIIVLITLAALGLPIGLSMIGASIFYLLLAGLDLGTAAEQLLNGLFNSYVLLAVPLFILAADLMNTGSLTDRLLKFCLVLVGRFRGGLGHVNVVANVIFAGMSASAIADAVGIGRVIIGMMTRDGKYPISASGTRRSTRRAGSIRGSSPRFAASSIWKPRSGRRAFPAPREHCGGSNPWASPMRGLPG
jgi:TRAP-type mannitol/chloroaromatic compound transport system permease large subunit